MEKYLGIPVVLDKKICSPLRHDKHPTCKFYWKDGILMFHDFSGDFSGDCFEVVKRVRNIPDFRKVLEDIIEDVEVKTERLIFSDSVRRSSSKKSRSKIRASYRKPNKADYDYWKSFGIQPSTLKKYSIYCAKTIAVNGTKIYSYKINNPAYVYVFGQTHFKIYFPFSEDKSRKFISNTNYMQGWNQLDFSKSDLLIITKSMKDVMALHDLGWQSIAPHSEGAIISEDIIHICLNRFKRVVLLYDMDKTGINGVNAMINRYKNLEYIFIKTAEGGKDVSDVIREKGTDYAKTLINQKLKASYDFKSSINYRDSVSKLHNSCSTVS